MNNKKSLTIKDLVKLSVIFAAGFLVLAIIVVIVNNLGVTTSSDEVKQDIGYATERVNDASLPKGQEKTLVKGVNGEKTIIYEVRRKNGTELSREVKSGTVTKQPVTEKVAVGTYVAPESATTPTTGNSASGSGGNSATNSKSPNSGVTNVVTGYCKDGTLVTGNPSARGKANPCHGHKGWRDY
jgi:LPXTG cell wall surface protein|nr:MAG TPA: G5 domain [Caudoviricetes sp.]